MSKTEKQKFPATIYVTRPEYEGDEDYLVTSETEKDALDSVCGEGCVATYQLIEVRCGKLVPQFQSTTTESGPKTRFNPRLNDND